MCMTRKSQSLLLSLNPSASDGILTWRTSPAKQMANQIWPDNDTASDWLNKKLVMICIYHELLSFKKKKIQLMSPILLKIETSSYGLMIKQNNDKENIWYFI